MLSTKFAGSVHDGLFGTLIYRRGRVRFDTGGGAFVRWQRNGIEHERDVYINNGTVEPDPIAVIPTRCLAHGTRAQATSYARLCAK